MLLTTKWVLFSHFLSSRGNSIEEDKDWDSCFIDLFLIDLFLIDLFLIDLFLIDLPQVSNPIYVPSFEPELSSIEPTPENRMIGKVYSRK